MKGDDLARQAAQLVTETTAENVEASKNKTKEALAAFDEAYQAFSDVQSTYASADFSQYFDYIGKRQESLGYAIASDDAILAKNKEEATAQNNAYNIADAEAAVLAKSLPEDPAVIIDETFAEATADVATLAILFKASTAKRKPTPAPASAPSSATSKATAEIPAETAAGADSAAPARADTDADAGTTASPSAEDATEIAD